MSDNLDSIIYYACNAFSEAMMFDKIEYDGEQLRISEVIDKISSDSELLRQLSTNNLVLIFSELGGAENQAKRQLINEIFVERMKNGESLYSGSNLEKDGLVGTSYVWNRLFNSDVGLSSEAMNLMKESVDTEYDEFKPNNLEFCETVLQHCNTYTAVGGFLAHYKNGYIDEEKMDFLREIVNINPNILTIINFGILQDDIFRLGKDFVLHLARYPNLAAKLIIIHGNDRKLYNRFAETISKISNSDSKSEYLAKIEYLLKYYSQNIVNIKQEDMDENLVDCAIYNHFQKQYYSNKFLSPKQYTIRNEIFDDMMLKTLSMVDMADVFSNRHFSMPYSGLKKFIELYGKDDSILESNSELKQFIENATRFINITDDKELRDLYFSFEYNLQPSGILKLESVFRRAYAETYVETMSKTNDYILANSVLEDGVQVCELQEDFGMPVHSTDSGFKETKELLNGNYADTWRQRKDSSDHLISTAYTDHNFLGAVSVGGKGVLYGFLKLKAEDINLIGPTDIDSHVRTSYYAAGSPQYYSASKLTRHARRVYAEIATERIGVEPDCVVLYDDMSEEVKANTYKAARDFRIPIVKINKTYVAERQLATIDKLIEEFKKNSDVDILCELVTIYETNLAGWLLNRDENNPVVQKGMMKYVNEDGTDANPDRTGEIDHSYLGNAFMARGMAINELIRDLIDMAKNNEEMAEVIRDMNKIIETMQKEMQTYAAVNESGVPITQTKFSFDGEAITSSAREVLARVAEDPKGAIKPTISIVEMVDASLNGRDAVTEADLLKADEQLTLERGSRYV